MKIAEKLSKISKTEFLEINYGKSLKIEII